MFNKGRKLSYSEMTQQVSLDELQRATRVYEEAAQFRRIAIEVEDDARAAYEAALSNHRHVIKGVTRG